MATPPFNWKAPDYAPVWAQRAHRLTQLRANPEQLAGLLSYYADHHPADFINDWMCTFDPRNAGLVNEVTGEKVATTLPFLLFPRQRQFIDWLHARWTGREDGLCEKSRDMGVSWLCCGFGVWMWRFQPGSVVGFGSRKEDYVDKIGDPSSLFWKIRTAIDLLPHEFKPQGYERKLHAPYMRVLNPETESVIVGEAGDNIGRGARAAIYFKDESAHYEHPDQVDAALSQTANTKIDVSTPNGEGNPFWQKRFGGKLPVFVFDWREDPRKGDAWYEKQRNTLDPVALAQEVDRDYSASVSNAFIKASAVEAAMRKGPADVRPFGGLRFGLDVARFGDDRCVLSVRRGRVLLKQFKWGKSPTDASAGRAKQLIDSYCTRGERPEQIAVDVIGIGSGVADLLRSWYDPPTFHAGAGHEQTGIVVDVNSSLLMSDGKNYNLRAFMWEQMRDWLDTASIPNDHELRATLTSLRYTFKGGALLLEDKADAKKRGLRSPDEADSLALTFAYPVTKRTPAPIPKSAIADYSVDAELGM